jgi:hypothetical protein
VRALLLRVLRAPSHLVITLGVWAERVKVERKLKRVKAQLAQMFRGDTGKADEKEQELRAQLAVHEADLEYIDVSKQ